MVNKIFIAVIALILVVIGVVFLYDGNSDSLNDSGVDGILEGIGSQGDSSSLPTGSLCGDGVCDSDEAYEICAEDCPRVDPQCANGVCEGGESYESCPQDCSLQDILGTNPSDGACQPGEDIDNAPKDCIDIQPNCGNAICDEWENRSICYEDCPFDNVGGEDNDGDECSSDSDCGSTGVCTSLGTCRTVQCKRDSQCGGCNECSNNICSSCGYNTNFITEERECACP